MTAVTILNILKRNKAIVAIFLLLTTLRLINLLNFPIFGDEALYLSLSDNLTRNYSLFLSSIKYGVMPVFIWILSLVFLINQDFFNLMFLGRIINVTLDLLSALLIYQISQKLFNKTTALLTTIFYLSLPLNFLHSRLILLESATNFFIILSLFLSLKLYNHTKFKISLLISTALPLTLSYFVKPLSIISFPMIFSLPIINILEKKHFTFKLIKPYLFKLLTLILTTTLLIALFYFPVSKEFSTRYLSSNDLTNIIPNFKSNIWRVLWWSKIYFTIPVILILILAFLFGAIQKNIKVFWLIFWIFSATFLATFNAAHFYPRHLYLLAPPIAILCGQFLSRIYYFDKSIAFSLLILIILPSWILNFKIIFNPSNAPIVLEDRQQFFEDWSSGVNIEKISQTLNQLSKDTKIIVFTENEPSQFWVFKNLYKIPNAQIIPSANLFNSKFLEPELQNLINNNTYLVLNKNQTAPKDWPVQKIASYPKGPNREISIYKLIPPK